MADVLVLAERLGKELAQDERTQRLNAAQKVLDGDDEAKKLLEDYQKAMQKVGELERDGKPIEVADKKTVSDAEEKISLNETLRALTRGQMDFVDMMRRVKEAIDSQLKVEI
jgi:cell fate (sporulation/competence/biofilm development) regulator YlbF (YheA/YmcA/DUF963 family)